MKRTYKKLICVILSAVLLLSALPLTVHAAATPHDVRNASDLETACGEINTNGGEHIINLKANITNGSIGITKSDAVVTVIGNGYTLNIDSQAVYVKNGATVNLGDGKSSLILKGNNQEHDTPDGKEDPGLVYVLSDSTCNMFDKVTLKDRKGNNYLGGGVTVEGGIFKMYGGTIENCGIYGGSVCYGGGVAVFDGGYFEMNGGTIKNCYVESFGNLWQIPLVAGGGVFVYRASFTMNGGTIEKCTATNFEDSDGIDAVGGGVAVITSWESYNENGRKYGYLDSDFSMNGGTIKNCSATMMGGALAAGMAYANFIPMLTEYTPHSGSNNPGIFLNGGSMIGNDANNGGAIFLNWIRQNITVSIKNMLIDSNSAYEGGAIDVLSYWTQTHIDNCTITNNTAESIGGGVCLNQGFINGYIQNQAYIKDTTITKNTSKQRGAGVYYNETCRLYLSGNNTIQDNTYNNKLNNLNIYMKDGTVCPVYINGDLTGSQIGLSDPTLWDDGKEDDDPDAVSTDYLTSGYKANNAADPGTVFTSDHETWIADFSDVNEDEVRLVRKTTVDYHINNRTIAKDKYNGNDIFTSCVTAATDKPVTVGETIDEFYTIPEIKPTAKNSCPYIFKGWYYDKANDNDENPVDFDTDQYIAGRDIYAHWIEVKNVAKDMGDEYSLPEGETEYGGFDLTGVQVRNRIIDTNFNNELKPGGLRFMTSLSMDVVNEINAIKPNNIEYGYVAATREDWINAHQQKGDKLQYVSATANGKNTSTYNEDNPQDYFGFATNVNCTSKKINTGDFVKEDHRNFKDYLLYTLVITYEDGNGMDKKVLARPYIRYKDANGLERVAYSEYRGISNTLGGCYTSYKAILPAP